MCSITNTARLSPRFRAPRVAADRRDAFANFFQVRWIGSCNQGRKVFSFYSRRVTRRHSLKSLGTHYYYNQLPIKEKTPETLWNQGWGEIS